jgi:hypothetical protein
MAYKIGHHLRENAVGYLALFFATGVGTAWAATELERNEVKSKHIGAGQVRAQDIANDAVTTHEVANGSLLDEDFVAGQLPQGERGPEGAQGVPGERGPAGISNLTPVANETASDSKSQKNLAVPCPDGTTLLSAGYEVIGGASGDFPNNLSEITVPKVDLQHAAVSVVAFETDAFSGDWSLRVEGRCATVAG